MTDRNLAEEAKRRGGGNVRPAIVDCDVHPALPNGIADLLPYMSTPIQRRVDFMLSTPYGQSRFSLPGNVMYMNPGGLLRRDATRDGTVPGSDPNLVAEQLLDRYNVSHAILMTVNVLGLGGLPDPYLAGEIARASNDWLSEHWLARDQRYRGSINITSQNPELAVREIDRLASRVDFAQVFFPLTNTLMGDPRYYPIYEVAEHYDIPIAIHPGPEMIYYSGAMPAGGIPTYYLEWHTLLGQAFAANVVSFLVQPVLRRFPRLKLIVIEAGCAWVPELLWRLDRDWMSVRDEVPWLTERPSTSLFRHVRFTTQPFVEAESPTHVRALCEIIHGHETLLFSSDYPHWDFDNPERVLADLDKSSQERIFSTNAHEFYGPRLRPVSVGVASAD